MSAWQPTEAMVSRAATILDDWFGHDEPTLRTDARDMLMEFGPAIAARAEAPLLAEIDRLREIVNAQKPPHELRAALRSERGRARNAEHKAKYWEGRAHHEAARALREAADDADDIWWDRWLRARADVIDPPALVSDDKERG